MSDPISALAGYAEHVLGVSTGNETIRDTYGPQAQKLEDQYAGKEVSDPVDVDVCFIPALLERFFNPQAHVEAEELTSFFTRCPYVITEDLSPEVLIVNRENPEGRWQKLSTQDLESRLAEFGKLQRGEGSDLCTRLLFSARSRLGDSRVILFDVNVLTGNARVSVSKLENFVHPTIVVAGEEVSRPDLAKMHADRVRQMVADGQLPARSKQTLEQPPHPAAFLHRAVRPSPVTPPKS